MLFVEFTFPFFLELPGRNCCCHPEQSSASCLKPLPLGARTLPSRWFIYELVSPESAGSDPKGRIRGSGNRDPEPLEQGREE